MKRGLVIFATGLVVLLAALTLTYLMRPADRPTGAATTAEVQIGGPFTPVDHTGRGFELPDEPGRAGRCGYVIGFGHLDPHFPSSGDARQLLLEVTNGGRADGIGGCADIEREAYSAGDHGDGTRQRFEPPDGRN